MPCCESEMQHCSAGCIQTHFGHGTASHQLQRENTVSTPNETCAISCERSTSSQVQSLISEMISVVEQSQWINSSTVESPAPPRRTISNARFSVCPNNTLDIQCYRTSPVALTSGGDRYSPFWKRSCEEQYRQSWYPTGTDWHDSVSSSSNLSANLMGANSWFTMKWKLHPEKQLFRTCSTSCTSTIVESREQESTSKKRKRGEKEKSEEQKRKLKEARMLKAHQQKEKRRQALEKMKAELGSRESLTIPIEDPEELKKIERKEELRQRRVLRKQDTETPKPKAKRPQRTKTATITKSFSVRIKPTKDQRDILNHWIGCARFTYNQGLSIVKDFTSREDRPSINESLFMTIKGQLVPYDKVDRDKPWLHNCPEKIRAYAVHKELYRTYKSNFERGVRDFEPKFRKKYGLQSIHMPKDKVVYCRKSQTLRLFPNHKMKTEHFKNLSGDDNGDITSGEYHIFGPRYRKTKTSTTAGERKRSKKKTRLIEKCFKENGKANYDVTFVRTATNKYELRLTFDESVEDVQERNLIKNPSKKFDSVFIDPGNRTFSTMYSPEGFSGSIGDKDISRMFGLLKTHDELQSEGAKKSNNKRKRRSGDEEGEGDESKTEEGDPNSLNGESKIQLAVIREKIKNLRDEVHWQTISFLLRNFKNIFIPKLDTNRMVLKGSRKLNKTAARQMLTWSHGLFIERLVSKSREFRDTHVHIVDECYTSKTCGECGTINESLGSSKWFSCRSCGFECERDLNGARNIFIKAVCEGVLTIS